MKSLYASKMTCKYIWEDFIAHFQSDTTIASYQTDIDEIMNYFQKDFLEIGKGEVRLYFQYLRKKVELGKIRPSTMAKKFRELHSFANYICEQRDKYQVKVSFQDWYDQYLKQLAKQEKHTKSIPVEHMDRLLEATRTDAMAYTILALLYRVGLSSTEIIAIKSDDFAAYDNGVYLTISGRTQASYIPQDVFIVIEKYLKNQEKSEPLFVNSRGKPLNLMYISRMMKKYTQIAGIPSYSAESVRNTCGVNMFSYGASPEQVAAQMGVTKMQIHRYNNFSYKEHMLREANNLVYVKILPPNEK